MMGQEKLFLCSSWGYEIFSNCAKSSSALVTRITNDRVLEGRKGRKEKNQNGKKEKKGNDEGKIEYAKEHGLKEKEQNELWK